MFRSFLRLVSSTAKPNPLDFAEANPPAEPKSSTTPDSVSKGSHRERLYSMRLQHVKLCGARRCESFAKAKVFSVGDLASCDPAEVARRMGAPSKAVATIKRYRRAIRLAASVPGLMPRDADLLIRIHRGSVLSIAQESPGLLHRDLQRFALSSDGARFVGNRRLPSQRKVKSWVHACQDQLTAKRALENGSAENGLAENASGNSASPLVA